MDEGRQRWRESPNLLQDRRVVTLLQLHWVTVLWSSLLPRLGIGNTLVLLEAGSFGLFIEEKISCCLIFRAPRMENITPSIYDVIEMGKVASAFSYSK